MVPTQIAAFSKGTYGTNGQIDPQALRAFHNYKVLENVTLNYEGKTQTIDFVLVGWLLFVSARGQGRLYGDSGPAGALDDEKRSALTTGAGDGQRSSCSAA
ncbi:MAG: hypothetical protein ACLRXC_11720 [[Clostridium] leptum]